MSVIMNPYLNFRGQAAEAMEFYQSVLGGELQIMRFSDLGGMGLPAEEQDAVAHSYLGAPAGPLMGADVPSTMEFEPAAGFSVSLSGEAEDEDTLRSYWKGLSDGAEIGQELEKAPWGDVFGMLTDRYGTRWMMNIRTQG